MIDEYKYQSEAAEEIKPEIARCGGGQGGLENCRVSCSALRNVSLVKTAAAVDASSAAREYVPELAANRENDFSAALYSVSELNTHLYPHIFEFRWARIEGHFAYADIFNEWHEDTQIEPTIISPPKPVGSNSVQASAR